MLIYFVSELKEHKLELKSCFIREDRNACLTLEFSCLATKVISVIFHKYPQRNFVSNKTRPASLFSLITNKVLKQKCSRCHTNSRTIVPAALYHYIQIQLLVFCKSSLKVPLFLFSRSSFNVLLLSLHPRKDPRKVCPLHSLCSYK